MSDQDSVQNKAQAAANAVATQVGYLWQQAHTDGLRDGMELAGTIADAYVKEFDQPGVPAEVVGLLSGLRDAIRLCAFQIPDVDETQGVSGG